jgi:integrase
MIPNNPWTKSKGSGLYRYNPTGQYFARVRFHGKLYRKKLDTADYELAKRKAADFRRDLERTDATKGNTSFGVVLDAYADTLTGADSTKEKKLAVIAKLKQTWFGVYSLPLRTVKPSQVQAWLGKHYGERSASHYNAALTVLRDCLELAVKDKIIVESPAASLKYRTRNKPIRPTPTFEQFKQLVADIRAQKFNREAEQSGDFVEFLGLAGLGQAETAAIKRSDVDLESARIIIYRNKTDVGFVIPIYPQLRPLVEKLCDGKKPHERLLAINQARKAIANACKRVGFVRETPDSRLVPLFTHRSFRRMFITRAIERGVDVKVIAQWQGHQDGGKLILSTYSHVRPEHSNRMAQLMTTEQPDNVISIRGASAEPIMIS